MKGIFILLLVLPYIYGKTYLVETIDQEKSGPKNDYNDGDYGDYPNKLQSKPFKKGDLACYKDDVIFNGFKNVIGKKKVATAQDCSLTCCKKFRCIHWTYKKSRKTCWLKGLIRKPDFIFGRKDCQLPPSEEESSQDYSNYHSNWLIEKCIPEEINARGTCYKNNANMEANISPLEENVQPTVQDCQKSCYNTKNCTYWNYKKSTKTCFLKMPPKNVGFISGQKNCALEPKAFSEE